MIKFHNLFFTCLIVVFSTSFSVFADDTNNCFQGNSSINTTMQIAQKVDLPTFQSTGKFAYSGCFYDIAYVQDTSQDWENTCYNFTLTRTSIESDSSEDFPDLTPYECEVKPDCGVDNPNSLASFGKDKITGYPKGSSGYLEFAGCKYRAVGVTVNSNQYTTQCLNYMFYRLNDPVIPVNNTMPDFTPFECVDKTCPSGQSLDSQGICQNIDDANIQPLSSAFKLVTCDIYNSKNSGELQCPQVNSFYSSYSASLSSAKSYIVSNVKLKSDFGTSYPELLIKTSNAETYYINSNSTAANSNVVWVKGRVTTHEYMKCGVNSSIKYALLNSDDICDKTCPSGIVVDYDVDCSTTIKNCPDGSTVNQGINCPTKICPNGDVIDFDLICGASGTGGTGDGYSGSGDNSDIIASLNSNTDIIGNKLDDLKDVISDSGDSTVADLLTQSINTGRGSFNSQQDINDVTQIKEDLKTRITNIKTEINTIIKPVNTSGGSFNQCYNIAKVFGEIKEVCLNKYQDEMHILSDAMLFVFAVLSAIIIFGGLK